MNGDVHETKPDIPPRLAEALRRHERASTDRINLAALDASVLDGIRARGQRRRVLWRLSGAMAAAAGLAVALYVPWGQNSAPVAPMVVFDATRPVTILEAFRLARLLESSRAVSPTWDVSGDGVVDDRDVEVLGARAVRLASLTQGAPA